MTMTIEKPGSTLRDIEDVTRREFLIGGAATLLLAGCAGDAGGGPSGETRTARHALGETEVPVSPERIAVLDRQATLSHLVALGVIPAAAGTQSDLVGREFPSFLYPAVEDVEPLPIADESFNLERLAALEPDLMIGQTRYIEGAYEELSRIAPTVAVEEDPFDHRPALLLVGEALGRRERAEELIEDFDRRVAGAADRVGDVGTVTLISVFPGQLRFWSPEVSVGKWISGFGGEVKPDLETLDGEPYAANGEPLYVVASEELLAEAGGESLVLLQNPGSAEDRKVLEETQERPLYRSLTAVRNGRVLTLDVQLALGNSGIQGFEIALEELVGFFSRDGG